MALENGSDMVMPVAPLYGNNNGGWGYPVPVMGGYGNGGFGGFGGDWGSLIVLFLIAAMFGGFGGMGFGGFGGFGGGFEFPWLLAGQAGINQNTNNGFDNAALTSQLSAIQSTLASNEVANCNRTIDSLQTAYSNQIASMNQSFANSQALDSRLDSLAMGLQNCCCENRQSIADLKYTVATEACADRNAVNNALRDVLTANTASTQRILDQLCADKIDAKNEKIADLERQLTMANLAASQTAQTAAIRAGQVEEIDAMYNRLKNCPVPSMPVYGNQPIFTCNNNGCGCGNFGGFNGNF